MTKERIQLILSTILFLAMSDVAYAQQESTLLVKKIRVHDFSIQSGRTTGRVPSGTIADFSHLAPDVSLLKNNLTAFDITNGFSSTDNTFFTALVGIQFSDKERTRYNNNPLLRVGISYYSGTALAGALNYEERTPYDTLTSAQSGQTFYVDSVHSHYYVMNYTTQQLRLDASFIYRTNPEDRWCMYAGIGVTLGMSFNNATDIDYNEYRKTDNRYLSGSTTSYYNFSRSSNTQSESIRNKGGLAASAYIPLGLDFRVGRTKEFWKRTHLFYEMRPSLNINSIPELRTLTNALIQHGFGLRITW